MRVNSLRLRNFRAFRSAEIDLSADVVAIYSRNGIGKTAIFDAIELAMLDELHRFENAKSETPVESYVTNVFGDGTFAVSLRFDDGTEAIVDGDRDGRRNRSGSFRDIHDLVFKYLVSPSYDVRPQQVATIRSVFRSTHFLSQQFIANLARVGGVEESTLATLIGSADLQKCADRAEKVVSELAKRLRNEYARGLAEAREAHAAAAVELGRLESAASARQQIVDRLTRSLATEPAFLKKIAAMGKSTDLAALSSAALQDVSVTAAMEAAALVNRLAIARTIVTDDTAYGVLVAQIDNAAAELKKLHAELRTHTTRATEASERLDVAATALRIADGAFTAAENQRRGRQQWHDAVEAAAQSRNKQYLASAAAAQLTATAAERDTAVAQTRSAISANERQHREAADVLRKLQATRRSVEGAIANEEGARQTLAAGRAKLDAWNQEQERLVGEIANIERSLEAARDQLQRLSLDTEDELSRVDELLAELGAHVSGAECPLCGHKYGSERQLGAALDRMRQRQATLLTEGQQKRAELTRVVTALSSSLDDAYRQSERVTSEIAETLATTSQAELVRTEALRTLAAAGCDPASHGAFISDLEVRIGRALQQQTESASTVAQYREEEFALANDLDQLTLNHFEAQTRVSEAAVAAEAYERDAELLAVNLAIESTSDGKARLQSAKTEAVARAREASDARSAFEREQNDAKAAGADLAQARERIADVDRQIRTFRERRESLAMRYADIGVPLDADATVLGALVESIEGKHRQLVAVADGARQLATLSVDGPIEQSLFTARQNEARSADMLATATARVAAAQRALQRATGWIAPLRASVSSAVTNFIGPHAEAINQIFRRMVPHAHAFEEIVLRASNGGGLDLGLRYRGKDAPSGSPEFFLSTAQMNVLALSIFLAFAQSQQWSQFETMLLDDPVQHLDDLDALAFLDMLRAVLQSGERRQVIISTCSRNLYAHIIRKFRLVEAPGLRFSAITLEDHPLEGATIRYDHGAAPNSAIAG